MSRIHTWKRAVTARLRGKEADAGAGFVEYAGLLILIAAIVTAVMGLGLDDAISTAIDEAVSSITDG